MGEEALPPLIERLQKHSDRFTAGRDLLWRHSPRFLQQRIRRPMPPSEVRYQAVRVLRELGPRVSSAVPALIRALDDPDERVRIEAPWALGRIGFEARAAVPALANKLRMQIVSTNAELRKHGGHAAALGFIGSPASNSVPLLLQAIQAPELNLRLYAAQSLGEVGTAGKAGAPALVAALGDKEWSVRRAAVRSLALLGCDDVSAVPALEALLGERSDVPMLTRLALWRVSPQDTNRIAGVMKDLEEPHASTGTASILGRIGADAELFIPALQRMTEHKNASEREAAKEALNRIVAASR
jgi:HEAT repeat protein